MKPSILSGIAAMLLFFVQTFAAPIKVQEAIVIGGIKQWISIKSIDDSKPVLLFLHGGPGNSVMAYSSRFTGKLENEFVVVHWDQRGAGKTKLLNDQISIPGVDQMKSDAVEMVNYLRQRFSRDRIYLIGHSWGGFLALYIAWQHPDLFYSCIAVSPMVDQEESDRTSLAWIVAQAESKHDSLALLELNHVKIPFENGRQLYYHRKWLAWALGNKPPEQEFVETWASQWLALYKEASRINLIEVAAEIKCPVYFFVGRKDYQTYFGITETYYKTLKAEKKQLFWFSKSGHSLNLTESGKFQDTVISLLSIKN